MSILYDANGTEVRPRADLILTQNLTTATNGQTLDLGQGGSSTLTIDFRITGTSPTFTARVEGTVNGNDWVTLPITPVQNQTGLAMIATSTAGLYTAIVTGYIAVRVVVTAISGTALLTYRLVASTSPLVLVAGGVGLATQRATAAVNTAATLTLAAVTGMRHYIHALYISRFATAAMTVAATPVVVTSANTPLSIQFPADAALQGTLQSRDFEFPQPVAASAVNTATSFTAPATPNAIFEIIAAFTIAP